MSTFVGFGFGAIQGGLFLSEAYSSNSFNRLVVSEIDQQTVDQVRAGEGTYFCNVAEADGVRVEKIEGLEIYNPLVPTDRWNLSKPFLKHRKCVQPYPVSNFMMRGKIQWQK
jgi:hypothetical protein